MICRLLLPLVLKASEGSTQAAAGYKLNDPEEFEGVPVRKLPNLKEIFRSGVSTRHKRSPSPHVEPDMVCPGPVVTHSRHCHLSSTPYEKYRKRTAAHPPHPARLAHDYLLHGGHEISNLKSLKHQLNRQQHSQELSRPKRSPEEFAAKRPQESYIYTRQGNSICLGDVCETFGKHKPKIGRFNASAVTVVLILLSTAILCYY
jgi:hypothetical protein